MRKAVVIGAGIAGIASAIRLVKKGYKVDVFEANSYPGGKLTSFRIGDYRFDAGPPLFTMPNYVDELFQLFDEKPSDFFTYKKKRIACKYFWEDGVELSAYSDKILFFNEVEKKLGVDSKVLEKYLLNAKLKYDLTAPLFLEQSLHKLSSFLNKQTIKAILKLNSFEISQNLHSVNSKQLKEPHLVQMYDRFATYNGSSPFKTPGIMTLIQHLEQEYGTFVPEGGMVQITNSLFELAKRKGVNFKMGSKVQEIILKQRNAVGITVDNKRKFYDYVFSNMDVFPTYKYLLQKLEAPKRILNQEASSSAVIFYWGIKRKFNQLDLHNVFFSKDYKNEFQSIFQKKVVSDDFTIYVNVTSKDVPQDAPKGCENWFVMINTPPDLGQDWNMIKDDLRKKVIDKLSTILNVKLEKIIEKESVMTPPMISQKTGSHLGALYGSSSNSRVAAFLRHPNFSSKIKNLYFCGGSVHPGGGIPLCLLSAKIATDLIPNASNVKY